jgi:hypothetical protein
MTARLHYGLRAPSAMSESTATSGYTGSNTATSAIRRPWVGTLAANGSNDEWVQHDYGSVVSIAAIAVNSCLQGNGSILYGNANPPVTGYGTINSTTVATALNGVRKGSWVNAVNARYIRADFTNASNMRGDGVFGAYGSNFMELGALYVFASSMTLPVDPLIDSDYKPRYPQGSTTLPNDQMVVVDRGAPSGTITLRFNARDHDIELIARIARTGLCWLDLGVASAPHLQWPVRFVDDGHTRPLARPQREMVTLTFREIS